MGLLDDLGGKTVSVNIPLPTTEEFIQASKWVLFVMDGNTTEGMEPGGFTTDLILLMSKADPVNMSKLALGFAAVGTAVDIYKTKADGVDYLRRMASKTLDTQPGDEVSPKGN